MASIKTALPGLDISPQLPGKLSNTSRGYVQTFQLQTSDSHHSHISKFFYLDEIFIATNPRDQMFLSGTPEQYQLGVCKVYQVRSLIKCGGVLKQGQNVL